QVGVVAGSLQELGDLADEAGSSFLLAGGTTKGQDRRESFPMRAAGLEDRNRFLSDSQQVRGSALSDVDAGEIERGQGGIVVEPESGVSLPHLPERRFRLVVPVQAGGDQAFHPAQLEKVHAVAHLQIQRPAVEQEGEGLARPAALVQGMDQVVASGEEKARVVLRIDEVESPAQQRHFGLDIAGLAADQRLLEQSAAHQVPLSQLLVDAGNAIEQPERFGELFLSPAQGGQQGEHPSAVEEADSTGSQELLGYRQSLFGLIQVGVNTMGVAELSPDSGSQALADILSPTIGSRQPVHQKKGELRQLDGTPRVLKACFVALFDQQVAERAGTEALAVGDQQVLPLRGYLNQLREECAGLEALGGEGRFRRRHLVEDAVQHGVIAVGGRLILFLANDIEDRGVLERVGRLPEGRGGLLAVGATVEKMEGNLPSLGRGELAEDELLKGVGSRMISHERFYSHKMPLATRWRVSAARHRVVILLILDGL